MTASLSLLRPPETRPSLPAPRIRATYGSVVRLFQGPLAYATMYLLPAPTVLQAPMPLPNYLSHHRPIYLYLSYLISQRMIASATGPIFSTLLSTDSMPVYPYVMLKASTLVSIVCSTTNLGALP